MLKDMLVVDADSHWSEAPDLFTKRAPAGFEDRVMFGADRLIRPTLMAYSIGVIQNADYLTPDQKRDQTLPGFSPRLPRMTRSRWMVMSPLKTSY